MGNRFITERFITRNKGYSRKRVFLRLNEADFDPHRMKPYGLRAGKFDYLQMFQKSHARSARSLRVYRSPRKAERQQAKRQLWKEE